MTLWKCYFSNLPEMIFEILWKWETNLNRISTNLIISSKLVPGSSKVYLEIEPPNLIAQSSMVSRLLQLYNTKFKYALLNTRIKSPLFLKALHQLAAKLAWTTFTCQRMAWQLLPQMIYSSLKIHTLIKNRWYGPCFYLPLCRPC